MGKIKERTHVVLEFLDFLAKLGIKSARRNVPPKFITGKNVNFYLNGVKMTYAGDLDYVVDNSSGPIVLRSDD